MIPSPRGVRYPCANRLVPSRDVFVAPICVDVIIVTDELLNHSTSLGPFKDEPALCIGFITGLTSRRNLTHRSIEYCCLRGFMLKRKGRSGAICGVTCLNFHRLKPTSC